jgi:hypothetical protein
MAVGQFDAETIVSPNSISCPDAVIPFNLNMAHMGPDMLAHVSEVSEEIAEDGKTVTV